MPNKQYESLRNQETASLYSGFDFTTTLREISQAEHWKNKYPFWKLISGACNDAGNQFYVQTREFVQNLADIDLCNVHALKSMAKSVGVEYLTNFINEDYPEQLQRLINIFSISRSNLFTQYKKLHDNSIAHKYGSINLRNRTIYPDENGYKISLLYDILEQLDDIRYVLETDNKINFNELCWSHINTSQSNLDFEYYFMSDGKTYKSPSLNKIFQELEYYKSLLIKQDNANLTDNENGIYGYITQQEYISLNNYGPLTKEEITKYSLLNKCAKVMYENNFVTDDNLTENNNRVYAFNLFSDDIIKNPNKYIFSGELDYINNEILYKQRSYQNDTTVNIKIDFFNNTSLSLNNNSIINIYTKIDNQETLVSSSTYENLSTFTFEANITYLIKVIETPRTELKRNLTLDDKIINPFIILIALFKNKIINFNDNSILNLICTNPTSNENIDITSIVYRAVETIQHDSKIFHEYFLTLHFYGLFSDMIVNNYLKNDWSFSTIDNIVTPVFTGLISTYTQDEVWEHVNKYISAKDFETFINSGINKFQRYHIDFIQYLSLINNFLLSENNETINNNLLTDENKALPYIIPYYNNDFDVSDNYNSYYRKLNGINDDLTYNNDSVIFELARTFADYCIQISIARENIKAAIQQFARIGTNKIIEDVTTDFFLKQFGNRKNWGLYSEKSIDSANSEIFANYGMFNDINNSTNDSELFNVKLIEYYDSTNYLNIQADLPSFTCGYTNGETVSTIISTPSTVNLSSVVVKWKLNEDTLSGTTNLGYDIVNSDDAITLSSMAYGYTTVTVNVNETLSGYIFSDISSQIIDTSVNPNKQIHKSNISSQVDGLSKEERLVFNTEYLNNPTLYDNNIKYFSEKIKSTISSSLSSIISGNETNFEEYQYLIPAGTEVYNIVPSSIIVNFQTTSSYIKQEPVSALCTNYIYDFNSRFWNRDFSSIDSSIISGEIDYWTPFFQVLQEANTYKNKLKIFKNDIYPFLSKIWNIHATSGFALSSELSGLQLKYAGDGSGLYTQENIGNTIFPTIAPLQNIENLSKTTDNYSSSLLYLLKPYYDDIAYYINLVSKEILNMHEYNQKTGLGTPTDGWLQEHTEYNGYNSLYEQKDNKISTIQTTSKLIDVDGPWVYESLQKFIKLYYESEIIDNEYQIPYNKIYEYVNENYIGLSNTDIISNVAKKLFLFQHEIIKKQYYTITNYQVGDNDTQFILYKHQNFAKYEDCGEIWIRFKNHCLAMPAMFYTIQDNQSTIYKDDTNDNMQCDEQITYANALKQLFNNAMQFGVIGNTMWILGYSNYINYDNVLQYSNTQSYLKLCFIQFDQSAITGTLKFNLASCKFISLTNSYDFLTNINEFVGVYYNEYNKSFEALLYDKNTFINEVRNSYNSNIKFNMSKLSIPLTQCSYNILNPTFIETKTQTFVNSPLPLAGLFKEEQVIDSKLFSLYNLSNENDDIIKFSNSGLIEKFVGYNIILSGTNMYNSAETTMLTGQITINDNNILNIYFEDAYLPTTDQTSGIIKSSLNDRLISSNIFPLSVDYTDKSYIKINNSLSSIINEFDNIVSGLWIIGETKDLPTDYPITINNNKFSKILIENIYKTNNTNISGTIENDINIWRTSTNNETTNIAYESINTEENQNLYTNLLVEKKSLYIDVLQFTFNIDVIKQNSVYISHFNDFKFEKIKDKLSIQLNSREELSNSYFDMNIVNNLYPYCNITNDNKLIVKTIVTKMGGNKSINTIDQYSKDLLMSTISESYDEIADTEIYYKHKNNTTDYIFVDKNNNEFAVFPYLNILNLVTNNVHLNNSANAIDYLLLNTASNCNSVDVRINANKAVKSLKDFLNDADFFDALNNGINGILYNKTNDMDDGMTILSNISLWCPCMTTCLNEPLKIICDFGELDEVTQKFITGSESFDLDISVYIDDSDYENIECQKSVGWHCGYTKTDFLNWTTNDSMNSGPEIVLVDLLKYQNYILNKFKNNLDSAYEYLQNVKIVINVCWHSESMLIALNPSILIAWKGYYKKYVLSSKNLSFNNGCCTNSNNRIISVDLINSSVNFQQNSIDYCAMIQIDENIEDNTIIFKKYYYSLNSTNITEIINNYTKEYKDIINNGNTLKFVNKNDNNHIITNWFVYDINSAVQNQTLSTIEEIDNELMNSLNSLFKFEYMQNDEILYFSPFIYNDNILSDVTDSTTYDIINNCTPYTEYKLAYKYNKFDILPETFITTNGIYSDILNNVFSYTFVQELMFNSELDLSNEIIKLTDTNINITFNELLTSIYASNNLDIELPNIHYYLNADIYDNDELIKNEIVDVETFDNTYEYAKAITDEISEIVVKFNLYYIRKYSKINCENIEKTYVYYKNLWNNREIINYETVIGNTVMINIDDRLTDIAKNANIYLTVDFENNNGYVYDIANNQIIGDTNYNIDNNTIITLNAAYNTDQDTIRILDTLSGVYNIINKKITVINLINATDNVEQNNFDMVYLRQDNLSTNITMSALLSCDIDSSSTLLDDVNLTFMEP